MINGIFTIQTKNLQGHQKKKRIVSKRLNNFNYGEIGVLFEKKSGKSTCTTPHPFFVYLCIINIPG